ncbi:MAG: hypothetical protein HYY93_16260 [Planctomycetes bacterium]|nr:hypothetical protein [Planctomycetota bacterium]
MTRLFSAVMGIFAFVVMCGLGLLQKSEGVEISLGVILLRAALAMAGFILLGWVVGSAGIRVVGSETGPKPAAGAVPAAPLPAGATAVAPGPPATNPGSLPGVSSPAAPAMAAPVTAAASKPL